MKLCAAYAPPRAEAIARFPDRTMEFCPNEATRVVQFDGGRTMEFCDFHADELEALGPARPELPC